MRLPWCFGLGLFFLVTSARADLWGVTTNEGGTNYVETPAGEVEAETPSGWYWRGFGLAIGFYVLGLVAAACWSRARLRAHGRCGMKSVVRLERAGRVCLADWDVAWSIVRCWLMRRQIARVLDSVEDALFEPL